LGSGGWDGQGVETRERGCEVVGPGPGLLDADPGPALPAGDVSGDVQEPVAQRLRFGLREVAVQEQVLGPGE
jgi:hypothetical protein